MKISFVMALAGLLLVPTYPRPLLLASPSEVCENSYRAVTPKNPRLGEDGKIISGQAIRQLRVAIDENTNLEIIEYPRAETDVDNYNSTIVLLRAHHKTKYSLGRLVNGGEVLRIVETARICTSPDTGRIFLAFESAFTGVTEAFVVVRYSSKTLEINALPVANQGKIVIEQSAPNQIALWSAVDGNGIECDACEKRYAINDCQLNPRGVTCSQRQRIVGPFSPNQFRRSRIDVR